MLTTPKQTEQYGHSNSQSNTYGPPKKHYKAAGKWKHVNHTEKTEQYGHSNSQSNKYGQHKKHYRAAEKMKKYINHTEKINNKFSVKRIWTTVKQNMDTVKQKPGHSQTETWTFWHWKTLQNSVKIDKSMSGTDMDNIFQ